MKRKILVLAFVFIAVFSASYVEDEFKIVKSLDIFINLFKELNYNYVDEIDPEKVIKAGIDGMLSSLDPYTTFIPESKMDDFRFQTTGQYGGIGAVIRRIDDTVVVAEPYENFPAAKAGLKAGDKILEVNGVNAIKKDVSAVSDMLKGNPGTTVEVLINRIGESKPLKVKITRERITIPNVPYYGVVYDSIGYIRLTNFTTDAGKEVREAVKDLKLKKVKALVLDIRDNPGGLLSEAVEVVNCFIPENQLVVFTKGKIKDASKRYVTIRQPVDTTIPLAVLTSRGSASASEIVAGALQDFDRAIIVGQRTFGKGLVQQTRPLSYNTQLKVTTAKYYIPSGRCIQAVDYSHRNEDGSVGYIPDSLIREFKTRAGRKVYDGGGITPDVKVETERISDITYNLYTKNLIFNYATIFAYKNKTIVSPEKFKINDYIYNDFITFLDDKHFDYKTRTEDQLKKLIETAKKEKYYSLAEEEFKQLTNKLSHDRNKDLQTFRDEISRFLADEIVSRYYYQKGRIIASLNNDKELDTAVSILRSKELYQSFLSSDHTIGEKDKKSMEQEEETIMEE